MTWDELKDACEGCRKCALYESRRNVVFGVGNPSSEVLFIGEGPGANEDATGEPFCGRAGKLLDDMLEIIGLSRRENIYIANIVKCRPPENRDPTNFEQTACLAWLRQQYKLIRPKVVVCLGRIAAGVLIGGDFKITRDHGKWTEKDGASFTAIYHPAALLRDPNKKPETFVDLKEIQRVIKSVCVRTY